MYQSRLKLKLRRSALIHQRPVFVHTQCHEQDQNKQAPPITEELRHCAIACHPMITTFLEINSKPSRTSALYNVLALHRSRFEIRILVMAGEKFQKSAGACKTYKLKLSQQQIIQLKIRECSVNEILKRLFDENV